MIIKTLILTTLLTNDPAMIITMPPEKIEMRRRNSGKGDKGRKRGGRGLR
jgi:hypothetical protein